MIEFQKNNASLSFSEALLKGDKGDPGATPNIQIGTVETLPAESPATASMTGTPENPLLNLGIPKGKDGGGGADDFVIKMTVEYVGDNYTVTSCDATVEQIDAAVAAEKRVILIATQINSGLLWEMPIVQGSKGNFYYFGTFLNGKAIAAFVVKDGGESGWLFVITQIEALNVDYSNTAVPNISTVEDALNNLIPKSHTHANKSVLDKLSVSNGKLQYNGSDVGLKGDKGDTPVKGTDYWTAADKTEIVNDTLAALPTWTGGGY